MKMRRLPPRPMGAPPADQYGAKDMFIYSAVLDGGLNTGSTDVASFNVDKDSDFLWTKGTYFASIGGVAFDYNTRPIPGITITIKDTTSGRDLMTTPVPIPSLFGTGELPFILPVPKLLPATSTITVNFASIDDANYGFVGLYFHGPKLFG